MTPGPDPTPGPWHHAAMSDTPDQLVELRNYTLVPGAAEAFADHFEQRFLASQEQLGMDIVGQFTVPGDDARFLWVRRFEQPAHRGEALRRFYSGPVWKEFGPRANELLIDSDDVHLLRPDPSVPAFAADHHPHAERPDPVFAGPASTVVAALYDLDAAAQELPAEVAATMTGVLAGADGVHELGRLVTAHVTNDFPALPVHEDAAVGVWLLADAAGGDAAAVAEAVATDHGLTLRTLRLTPTGRSTLH